ncbi:MAG: cyclic nucleotide-binding domain-containing protein [Fusobacteriaceae bacterium]|nr:cyclic nucleotide-binding domain-containing protein [Fusobacteriaceae bacterium]
MENYNIVPFSNIKKVLPILNKISLLGGLSQSEISQVFSLSEWKSFNKNEIIFKKGDSPNYIYIIISGQIKLYISNSNVEYEFLDFTVGDCLGEASLISIEPHGGTAICQKKTECIMISRKTLFNLHKNYPTLFSKIILNIARELARRLHKNTDILAKYMSLHSNIN